MGEGLRMVVGGVAFDGGPLVPPALPDWWVSGPAVERQGRFSMARAEARREARESAGRAPHAPMLRPMFGPDAPTRPVLTRHEDGSYGAGTVQVVPRIRIEWL